MWHETCITLSFLQILNKDELNNASLLQEGKQGGRETGKLAGTQLSSTETFKQSWMIFHVICH
jgi:hypothetical protein